MKHRPVNRASAYRAVTLVEIMIVLAIGSVLLSASLVAVTRITRAQIQESRPAHVGLPREAVQRLVQRDLRHAWRVRSVEGGIAFETLAVLDAQTNRRSNRPATISYIVPKNKPYRLMRIQQSASHPRPLQSLVCVGVLSIETDRGKPDWRELSEPIAVTICWEDAPQEPMTFSVGRGKG
jgi:prepilin-type N-terminal cleavage/methylation domain-containing protein